MRKTAYKHIHKTERGTINLHSHSLFPQRISRQSKHVHFDVRILLGAGEKLAGDDFDFDGVGDDAVDGGLDKRVQSPIFTSHKVRLQDVTASAVVLEHSVIQHHP